MASIMVSSSTVGLVSYNTTHKSAIFPAFSSTSSKSTRPRSMVVKAEGAQAINPEIRKTEDKVVDSVVVSELSKPLTPYCRCWRSGTFPLCDGSHVKHNKATGDNVGPLLLKKQ
ncbi:CDGSH iron-sulfur domain-containing protein 2A [Trema orientale]|uniref:CDGSH iron-sulfur domain-containing protein 2A n=1 Tax=Trema orientale TaxID=63057 RepID=A0A2P5CG12_TREOI|nr:CDGSH iron-sulfur domain-containing protein 2A [Trema orientale]